MNLEGTITALVTPFKNHEVDEEGLRNNIRYQIAQGINGIVLLGTTGEASTLSTEEQTRIITIGVEEAKGKVPVWVGTGSYCTAQTMERTKRAKDLGADVALIVTPYYNRPTQEGIYRHFEAIASHVDLPIVAYNIPGRCGTNIEASTILRIADLPNMKGIKESSGNILQTADFFHAIHRKYPGFHIFSGDDSLALPMIALGAVGLISVVSNLIPDQIRSLVHAALNNQFERAKEMHYHLLPLFKTAFIETNPIPIKTAMNICGMAAGECRLPLCQMSKENVSTLHKLLIQMQLAIY